MKNKNSIFLFFQDCNKAFFLKAVKLCSLRTTHTPSNSLRKHLRKSRKYHMMLEADISTVLPSPWLTYPLTRETLLTEWTSETTSGWSEELSKPLWEYSQDTACSNHPAHTLLPHRFLDSGVSKSKLNPATKFHKAVMQLCCLKKRFNSNWATLCPTKRSWQIWHWGFMGLLSAIGWNS